MYLTQDQAKIALHDQSALTTIAEINQEINKLKTHPTGQYSIMLSTGTKLKYDINRKKFYLNGYHYSEFDNLYIYDSLEILEDYWEYLKDALDFSEDSINSRKKAYKSYKTSISYRVA